jgi:uracil-DNA glycosylase
MTVYNQQLSQKNRQFSELSYRIRNCTRCGLCNERTNAVTGEGSLNARVFFIGEAPGRNEDITGRPFCGAAGKILDLGLEAAGMKRQEVFITSVVKCRPPKNRNPKPEEMESCRPFLDSQLRIINPAIIVLLGNFGLRQFFEGMSITESRGKLLQKEGRSFFPIFHPAAIIYKRSNMDIYISDFRKLKEILGTKFK